MPYMNTAMHLANHTFAPIEGVNPEELAPKVRDSGSLVDLAQNLGLFDVLPKDRQGELRTFLAGAPQAIDAAVRAATLSAVERGLHTQLMWRPAYEWSLELWEVSDGSPPGALSLLINAPHPYEAAG
jgi:hypothetical protein